MASQPDEKKIWYVLEANCSLYKELMEEIGMRGLELIELSNGRYKLLKELDPILGIIFLFKRFYSDEELGPVIATQNDEIFYIKQVNFNANFVYAIVSIVLNSYSKFVTIGNTLESYKSECYYFNPHSRGVALKNNENLRRIHNHFALRTYPSQRVEISRDNNRYHFTCLIPIRGRLFEVDGLKEGPVDLGSIDERSDWLRVARRIIKRRMVVYNHKRIHFQIMAVTIPKSHTDDFSEIGELPEKLQNWTLLKDFKKRRMSKKRRKKMKDARKINEDNWSLFIDQWSRLYAESVDLRRQIKEALVVSRRRIMNDPEAILLRRRLPQVFRPDVFESDLYYRHYEYDLESSCETDSKHSKDLLIRDDDFMDLDI